MNIALIFALLVAIVAVVFAFQNPDTVSVRFLGMESRDASLALVLLVTYAFGVITGWLGALPGKLRAQAAARRAAREAETERTRAVSNLNAPSNAATTGAGSVTGPDPYTARFGEPPNRV